MKVVFFGWLLVLQTFRLFAAKTCLGRLKAQEVDFESVSKDRYAK